MGSLGPTGLSQQPPTVPMTTANEALSSLETRGAAQASRPSSWNREDTERGSILEGAGQPAQAQHSLPVTISSQAV